MEIKAFRVQMYRCILDSDWIEVTPLTVVVGKNEAGKTTLLRALHKFNPFKPEPYSIDREWPRGHRKERNDEQVVCAVRFELSPEEIEGLAKITDQPLDNISTLEVTKDYAGRFEVEFPSDLFPDTLHPNDIDEICTSLPELQEPVEAKFKEKAEKFAGEAKRLAHEGRFSDLENVHSEHVPLLQQVMSPDNQNPQRQNEQQYITQYQSKLQEIAQQLSKAQSIQKKAHEFVISRIPTFIYMSDYRAFTGTARLDQVLQRQNQPTEEDKTLITIMELSGLDLKLEAEKGNQPDREQRQYDLDDASATLTNEIADRWKQRRYEVQFRADGQFFYTFVKDQHDPSLIRLEERSKGFQWFFSFDLMFMYESQGTFKGCVILLDEPGLHLHPDAQKDLLVRMEAYAKDNTLIYTTHLPFMIDLRSPERIRILSETENGVIVTDDLTQSQPEGKFVLQAALGMSGSTSYLVAQRNLVVEGVDDYWIITELSRLLGNSDLPSLPSDVFITPAGGASEAGYIATFMIGQKLDVVVLLDSDRAGQDAKEKLVKKWLTRYHSNPAHVLSLGDCVGVKAREFSIEDMFPDEFYLERVKGVYKKQLALAGVEDVELTGGDQLCNKVERALEKHDIKFNKGPVAKVIRSDLSKMKSAEDLPPETKEMGEKVFAKILEVMPAEEMP
ncbi:MAG: AAA family ATPase [Deltaproteobacteria bacterium]|nr:AAA family ATPase [Deltaproteobacteria bacterium]